MTSRSAADAAPVRGMVTWALVAVATVAWGYLGLVAAQMGDMSSTLAMPMTSAWSSLQGALMITMWFVMMAAMMLPSAVPMVVTYDRLDQRTLAGREGSAGLFVAGYAVVWSTFAVAAAGLQWVLHTMALVNGMGEMTHTGLAGSLLVAAGAFQFSPMKRRSLGACRTPMGFLTTSWREGGTGALRMGLHHGTLCLRCCWAVMVLLFVFGVMNLLWVGLLAIFVLAEKVAPGGEATSTVGGLVMVVWGIGVLWG